MESTIGTSPRIRVECKNTFVKNTCIQISDNIQLQKGKRGTYNVLLKRSILLMTVVCKEPRKRNFHFQAIRMENDSHFLGTYFFLGRSLFYLGNAVETTVKHGSRHSLLKPIRITIRQNYIKMLSENIFSCRGKK